MSDDVLSDDFAPLGTVRVASDAEAFSPEQKLVREVGWSLSELIARWPEFVGPQLAMSALMTALMHEHSCARRACVDAGALDPAELDANLASCLRDLANQIEAGLAGNAAPPVKAGRA